MKNKISRILGSASGAGIIASFMAPMIGLAQNLQYNIQGQTPVLPPAQNVSFSTLSGALCTVVAWIFTLLVILTVIYVLFAAYNYLTSSGEEEKIKKANHQLLYAAIALIVAILSKAIPAFVGIFLGTQGNIPLCQ